MHRSYLVALRLVTGLRTSDGAVLVRLRANGASPAVELPVSRRQARELRDRRGPRPDAQPEASMTSSERPQRERVVLAHRRGARMVRTRVEVQEQTQVGDALVRGLVRAQLGLALRLAAVVVCTVGRNPVAQSAFPELAAVTVFGIRLNWLVLARAGVSVALRGRAGCTCGWPSRASATSSASWSSDEP